LSIIINPYEYCYFLSNRTEYNSDKDSNNSSHNFTSDFVLLASFLSDLINLEFSRKTSTKPPLPTSIKCQENSSSVSTGAPYGQTDKYGKGNSRFKQLSEAPNNARVANVFHYFVV